MKTTNNGMPSAYIVSSNDRGRKKIYLNNKVYLQNNSSFEIEMFNPLQESVLAELKINGKLASTSGLILRPGEKFYLDCNIDDRKKFIFKTYEIDSNDQEAQKAVENNGYVEVSFYREKTKPKPQPKYKETYRSYSCGTKGLGLYDNPGVYTLSSDMSYTTSSSSVDFYTMDFLGDIQTTSISNKPAVEETGRIEKGNTSNQQFVAMDMDFETYCLNRVMYQILPDSKRPIETVELKTETGFCGNCGNRLIKNDKFCRGCGTRI